MCLAMHGHFEIGKVNLDCIGFVYDEDLGDCYFKHSLGPMKNAGSKKIYLEFLPGGHCKKVQEFYDQHVKDEL